MRVEDKLGELFDKLHVDSSMETFANRKLLQKLTYMIEAFGIDLGFRFSWYVHGPYDKRLTSVLYQDGTNESDRPVPDKYLDEEAKLKNLQDFLDKDIKSSRTMELIVSLHYLQRLSQKTPRSDDEIIENLLNLKPHFEEHEAKYYLKRIKQFFT
jgi:uncharacterized protein YwgA